MRRLLGLACLSLVVGCGSSAEIGVLEAADNSGVAECCKKLFPPGPDRGQCVSDGAHGKGPCGSLDMAAPVLDLAVPDAAVVFDLSANNFDFAGSPTLPVGLICTAQPPAQDVIAAAIQSCSDSATAALASPSPDSLQIVDEFQTCVYSALGCHYASDGGASGLTRSSSVRTGDAMSAIACDPNILATCISNAKTKLRTSLESQLASFAIAVAAALLLPPPANLLAINAARVALAKSALDAMSQYYADFLDCQNKGICGDVNLTCKGGLCCPKDPEIVACGGNCVNGTCRPDQVFDVASCTCQCPTGEAECNGKCFDTSSDPTHCGTSCTLCVTPPRACTVDGTGIAVPSPAQCVAGECDFPISVQSCGAGGACCTAQDGTPSCVDTTSDMNNCGGCGIVCHSPEVCEVIPPATNPGCGCPNGGTLCGATCCTGDEVCANDTCVPGCGGQPLAPGQTCCKSTGNGPDGKPKQMQICAAGWTCLPCSDGTLCYEHVDPGVCAECCADGTGGTNWIIQGCSAACPQP